MLYLSISCNTAEFEIETAFFLFFGRIPFRLFIISYCGQPLENPMPNSGHLCPLTGLGEQLVSALPGLAVRGCRHGDACKHSLN